MWKGKVRKRKVRRRRRKKKKKKKKKRQICVQAAVADHQPPWFLGTAVETIVVLSSHT